MSVLAMQMSPRVSEVLNAARHFTVDERIVLAKLLLDTIVTGEAEDSADWQALGLRAFEEDWDNPDDAIYDDWRTA